MTETNINESAEIWKPVLNYEGLYEVSNMGRVRSLERQVFDPIQKIKRLKSRVLKSYRNRKMPYPALSLSKNGVKERATIHRLVIESFQGYKNLFVDHKNGIQHDNRLSNLEYVTCRENNLRGSLHKLEHRYIYKRRGRYSVQISCNGKRKTIGDYVLFDDALKCRDEYLLKYNIEPWSGFKNG